MNLLDSLHKILNRYYIAIGIIVFLIGILLRAFSINYTSYKWQLLGELGTFLAAAVAISFIYNLFIRNADREIFLTDLSNALDKKLPKSISCEPIFYEKGRRTIAQKIEFYSRAKSSVVVVGFGLRAFSSYFTQRPEAEFRTTMKELIGKGINIKILIINPESKVAKVYATDRDELDYIDDIHKSLARLKDISLNYERGNLPGSFEIYTYSHFPYLNGVFIDIESDEGCMYVSHYLYGTLRSDTVGIEFSKLSNPDMFEKYKCSILCLLEKSQKVNGA